MSKELARLVGHRYGGGNCIDYSERYINGRRIDDRDLVEFAKSGNYHGPTLAGILTDIDQDLARLTRRQKDRKKRKNK